MSTRDAIREARVYLARIARPGATALSELVDDLGPVAAADRVRAGHIDRCVTEETSGRHTFTGIRDTDFGDTRRGIRLVIPEDTDEWPQQLAGIPMSPDPENDDAPARAAEFTQIVVDTYRSVYQAALTSNRAPLVIGNHFNDWSSTSARCADRRRPSAPPTPRSSNG